MNVLYRAMSSVDCNLAAGMATIFWALGALWSGGVAAGANEGIKCGATIWPAAFEVLVSADLENCHTDEPALTIVGPVEVDLTNSKISCEKPVDPDEEEPSLLGIGINIKGSGAIVRGGFIENCATGVEVGGEGDHDLLWSTVTSPSVSKDAKSSGFKILSGHNKLDGNIVESFAGEGFQLDDIAAAHNYFINNVARYNRNHGFRVREGENNRFVRNLAHDNVGEGFRSDVNDNRFTRNRATDNVDEGFRIKGGEHNLLLRNFVQGNGLAPCDLERTDEDGEPDPDANPGIAITDQGARNKILYNTIVQNCIGIAIETGSMHNRIISNVALDNQMPFPSFPDLAIDLLDGNPDCDNNTWIFNEFKVSASFNPENLPPLDVDPECIR